MGAPPAHGKALQAEGPEHGTDSKSPGLSFLVLQNLLMRVVIRKRGQGWLIRGEKNGEPAG